MKLCTEVCSWPVIQKSNDVDIDKFAQHPGQLSQMNSFDYLCSFGTVELTHRGQALSFRVNIFPQ